MIMKEEDPNKKYRPSDLDRFLYDCIIKAAEHDGASDIELRHMYDGKLIALDSMQSLINLETHALEKLDNYFEQLISSWKPRVLALLYNNQQRSNIL